MFEKKKFFDMSPIQALVLGLSWGIALVAVVWLAVLLSGADFGKGSDKTAKTNVNAPSQANNQVAETADVSKLADVIKDAYSDGPKNAKVTLVEISDFQCPYCQRHAPTMEQIMADYKGKVRRVWINLPLSSIHPYAQKAAEAAECAGEQGKFWEMHDKLFENQSALTVDNLKSYAKGLGLNTGKFNSCLDDGKYATKVQKQSQAAAAAGVSGTPGTFVNDQLVKGAYPYETFKQLIDAELAK